MNLDLAFQWLISTHAEGSTYVNDPKDTGGESKYGISKKAYPNLDIKNLTKDQAQEIYLKEYWDKCLCSRIPSPLNIIIFDMAVNSGCSRAIKTLQQVLRINADGIIGNKTLSAIGSASMADVVPKFMAERALFLTTAKTFEDHGRGWLRRLFYLAEFIK